MPWIDGDLLNTTNLNNKGGQTAFNVKDAQFGAVGDGVTDDTAAIRSALSAARNGRIAQVYVPNGTYAVSDIVLEDQVEVVGESRNGVIFDSYATNGAAFRCIGTVNVSGSNRVALRNMTIRAKSSASAAIALLYGGENTIRDVSITNSGSNRFQFGVILDQQVIAQLENVAVDGHTGAGVWAPHTGEFTRYGTTTGAFVTVINIVECDFNSQEGSARGIALNGGEAVLVRSCNFNALYAGIELANIRGYTLLNNYFERTSAISGTATPAIWLRTNSHGAAASIAPCKSGNIIGNHIEWAVDAVTAASQNGATIVADGHSGHLNIFGNTFMTEAVEAGYVVRVASAVSAINFHGNFDLNEDHAKTYGHTGVVFDAGVTDVLSRYDRTELVYPSQVSRLGFGAKSFWVDTPTLATGKTVERGDVLLDPIGAALYQSTQSGTRGSAGASNVHTTNNSSTVTSIGGGNNGNIAAGDWVTIAGAGGPYRVKEMYTLPSDNKITYVMASNVTAGVSNAAIAFYAPSFETLHSGRSHMDGSAILPSMAFRSEGSVGFYRPGAGTLAFTSGNSLNLNQSRLLSVRTLAASAITAEAANTNVRADELVLTVGGASGASLAVHSGGTVYIFNSALSARAT